MTKTQGKRRIDLGVLYSRSGSYALIARACRTGALKAVEEVNADPTLDIAFTPVMRDPQGNTDAYAPLCEEILRTSTARHVIGCVTSWSRKDVIPALERANGSLWYSAPYEGFEASDRVVYTHACANQHLLPLLDFAYARYGRRVYLTGSNYIWGWEMNRLAREITAREGGAILGERYLPLGSTEVDRMVEEIRETRPDFVLNQLIGPSQYVFLDAYAALGREDPYFRPDNCPVMSCNLTECELPAIGAAAEGLISAGPWFVGGPKGRFGDGFGSSIEAATHASVHMLARLLNGRPGAEDWPLAQLLDLPEAARLGIDPHTHHTAQPALIAQVQGGAFQVLRREDPIEGDPYLTRGRDTRAHKLRVVQ
ncbi:MAG: N-acetylmuramoyl-L-alanine amidase [Rhodobacteraceae bacterium]|nr:N-acetylmuramoyl-L-alanine amidase [Paracoccaceae bacterium]QEW18376.1 Aliphatic amidase expression-regulating protein [Marinibacterium anthonyi]